MASTRKTNEIPCLTVARKIAPMVTSEGRKWEIQRQMATGQRFTSAWRAGHRKAPNDKQLLAGLRLTALAWSLWACTESPESVDQHSKECSTTWAPQERHTS